MKLVNTIEFKKLGDDRGSLVSLEQNKNIPFEIKRIYYIFGTKDGVSGNDSNLLIVFYVQIMPDDFVMQLHRF